MVGPVIPVLGAPRQEAHESEVSLGYCGNILLAWTTVVLYLSVKIELTLRD